MLGRRTDGSEVVTGERAEAVERMVRRFIGLVQGKRRVGGVDGEG